MDSIPQRPLRSWTLAQKHADRARALGAKGTFTDAEWEDICRKYGYRCLCCGAPESLTVDHVVPYFAGGSNFIGNVQPLCYLCNVRKGARTIDYRPAEEGFTPLPSAPAPKKVRPLIIGPYLSVRPLTENQLSAPYMIMACRILAQGNTVAVSAKADYRRQSNEIKRRKRCLDTLRLVSWETLPTAKLESILYLLRDSE